MTTVTLGYPATRITLSRILDYDETKSDRMPTKHPIGAEAETQADYHVTFPTIIEMRCRLSDAEKILLYTIEAQTAWQPLIQNGTTDYVWVENIEMEYEGGVYLNTPWLTRITLLCRDK